MKLTFDILFTLLVTAAFLLNLAMRNSPKIMESHGVVLSRNLRTGAWLVFAGTMAALLVTERGIFVHPLMMIGMAIMALGTCVECVHKLTEGRMMFEDTDIDTQYEEGNYYTVVPINGERRRYARERRQQ